MSAPTATAPVFDITAPVPAGTTILEASAGTGKTWAIAALVARVVAEGTSLDQILVVTFGRAATQELRERVRERLIRSELYLRQLIDGHEPARRIDRLEKTLSGDASGTRFDVAELRVRHHRLRDALGAFDDATIATIHQFCHSVLRSLGVAGDTDPGTTLVEDLSDLLAEVVDDLYLARYARLDAVPFSHKTAREIATKVVGDPAARIGPADAEPGSVEAERVAFAEEVRSELAYRKRRLGVLSYDDLLADLAAALEDPRSPTRARLRERWSVVLVDEFQDTDPVQWQVFERAFHGHGTLVLIGDPKQAIYAFRGGDINTYLRARQVADHQQTLAVNRRSDAPLVAALSAGLGGMTLGDPAVEVHPVTAAQHESRLSGLPNAQPWRLRVASRAMLDTDPDRLARVDKARPILAKDCATDIARVLSSAATFDGRPVAPGDIAVLCHTGKQLRHVRDALQAAGIPAVLAADDSVLRSPAAKWWLMLLEAMEMPNRSRRVRTAALTPFIGESITALDQRGEVLTDDVAAQLRRWAELFALRGIPAVVAAARAGGLDQRLLATAGGERSRTDVHHLAEVLHDHVLRERLGLNATTTWLRRQLAEEAAPGLGHRSRRLESDAAAVQLATIHASKGLQFPIVYAPFLADRFDSDDAGFLRFHDTAGNRVIDVRDRADANTLERAKAEDDGESLRMLYVALTRAQSQVVTWWAPTTNTPTSPLHRALLGRSPGGHGEPERSLPVPSERIVTERLGAWAAAGGPQPEWVEPGPATLPATPPPGADDLAVRTFDRQVDVHWRRTSYSALSKAAEDAAGVPATSEPELPGKDDEAPGVEILPVGDTPTPAELLAADVPSPMATLPVGATFGSLVHAVLEEADPAAGDLRAEFLARIEEQIVRWPVELNRATLADALVAVSRSPLGPLASGAALADIGRSDRLCELEFELPLVGGDHRRTVGDIRLGELAPLLRAHLPEGDPLLDYAAALAAPELGDQVLRGYLTGSVDVVLRVGDRYLVVDYKTNWLGAPDAELTAADYRPRALVAAMQHSSYPLQALLYAVVLHRFLRWRLPGYDPVRHFGGVLYLYLRGMCGPDTPVIDGHPTGVFSWQPPVALVTALSDLLDGRAAS
ncbi:UvrD-helicase domain-containing protein [Nostocoides australiense]